MLKQYKKPFVNTFRFIDVLIVICSFNIAYGLRFGVISFNVFNLPEQYQPLFFIYLMVWIYLSNLFGLYSSKRHERGFKKRNKGESYVTEREYSMPI